MTPDEEHLTETFHPLPERSCETCFYEPCEPVGAHPCCDCWEFDLWEAKADD